MVYSRSRSRSRSPHRPVVRRRKERRPVDAESDKMVFLKNLPTDLKWGELKDLIRDNVGETAYVEFLEDPDGNRINSAILDFDHKGPARKCVKAFNHMELSGYDISAEEIREPMRFFRALLAKEGIDFLANRTVLAGRGYRNQRSHEEDYVPFHIETYGLSPTFLSQLNIKPPLARSVFVSNIPFKCGVGKLYDIFALAGRITWIDFQLDHDGKMKGMAIVQYTHPIEAVQAISMLNNQYVFERKIAVKMDKFGREPDRAPGELPAGLLDVGMGLGANGAPLADIATVISSFSGANGNMGTPSTHYQPTVQSLAEFINDTSFGNPQPFPQNHSFSSSNTPSFGGRPMPLSSAVDVHPGSYSRSMPPEQQHLVNSSANTGFVSSPQQPGNTETPHMNSSGFTSAPNNMYMNLSSQDKYDSRLPPPLHNDVKTEQQYNYNPQDQPPTPSYKPSQNQQPYYEQPTRVILIKNLPADYTGKIVKDRVQSFGAVENSEMISPGAAKIRFLRIQDAEAAKAALSGTSVEGRTIAIEYL